MKTGFSLFLLLLLFPFTARAGDAPVEITATDSLVWNREKKTYTAFGDVIAKQDNAEIHSATLTAFYNEETGTSNITTLQAEENVVVLSEPYTAYGDKAVYDVATGHATLTGTALKIVTEGKHLTAKDKIEFFTQENRLTATGNATVVRGDDKIISDVLNGIFTKDEKGDLSLTKVTTDLPVTVMTPKETITGDKGVYDIPKQEATITGNVRIQQGKSWLEGTRATVDMNTGISRLFADDDKSTNGRVKGVFYPRKENKTTP